jgi:hypothetical protein
MNLTRSAALYFIAAGIWAIANALETTLLGQTVTQIICGILIGSGVAHFMRGDF